ncbi:serine/threonine protein kinase [Ectopseudomonas hydrolytica]|uniref:Serine/threonine protein kinase n=1 Tax=Ectopseudomonas hydrolytica TaxID=2493633 RepID=A0ABY5A9Q5_9GAMM|nr:MULTISPECIES: lipopolysaccharide kinase InaA family protein [Pseudomonas]MDH0097053.1 serine/threonine protein kinase [Pseudomonas sp. GD04158]USR40440.1 serine/threonine protein kinase [Pseudomonas hydrolytica]
MPLHKLSQAGRTPTLPLTLELAGEPLVLERLLRVLPGQRYVGVAHWLGRQVLAKVLVGGKAQRHFQRELEGAERMARQGLDTPELLAHGFVEGQGGWLLFEYLDGAQSLWQAWREVAQQPLLGDGQQGVLAEALGAIGRMHAQGLWQDDLHLDNLLRHEGRLYLIDGGGVRWETPGQPLSRAHVLENLGVFFAQLPAELDPFLEELLIHYLLANGEHALPLEMLQAEIAKVRRWRLRDYLKKAARDCSLFAARIGAFGLRVVRREAEAALQPLLSDLDARIEAGHIYKTGGAATVARVELDDRQLVVKRYNVKNWLHWLKRFWRPSRAWHSWIEGNRLELLGIATPRPLAVIERRWCWLRGRAYLITDYCGGQDIIARFEAYKQAVPPENELLALDRLFAALLRERISHGDFKGHNLFWDDAQGAWSLIDLDAMRQHHSTRSFARAYARDRARFLRNWPADSALHQLLDQRLPQVPGTCPN